MGKKNNLEQGWAHNPAGFTFQHGGESHEATCQATTCQATKKSGQEAGACSVRARYARTLWDAGVIFSCGRHRDRVQDFARPLVAMGSRGPAIMRPIIEAPLWWDVPGAVEPVDHPVHIMVRETEQGETLCWCGAVPGAGEHGQVTWTGGNPLDTPWWEAKRREEAQTA